MSRNKLQCSSFQVYRVPIRQTYRATLCSGATVVQLVTIVLTIILPIIIAFRTHGFWLTTNTYMEQPEVHFKHQFILLLQGRTLDEYYLWSTYPAINQLAETHQRISSITARSYDENRDGKPDGITITLRTPIDITTQILSVQALLIFDYKLELQSRLQMETAVIIDETNMQPSIRLLVTGDLHLQQRVPLRYAGRDTELDQPVIDTINLRPEQYLWENILHNYYTRNLTTDLQPYYRTWSPASTQFSTTDPKSATRHFELKLTIKYPEQRLTYYSGFWELLKWAWIQYLSLLVIFMLIFSKLREIIFTSRMVTVIPDPVHIAKVVDQ